MLIQEGKQDTDRGTHCSKAKYDQLNTQPGKILYNGTYTIVRNCTCTTLSSTLFGLLCRELIDPKRIHTSRSATYY